MTQLVIATCQAYPTLPENLRPLLTALQQVGIETSYRPWQQISATHAPDVVLPLCAWDYADNPTAFRQWLHVLSTQGCALFNPERLITWNMHKHYLCDLQQAGIHTIPTLHLPAERLSIQQAVQTQHWQDIVIKPAVGQSGKHVCKILAGEALPDLSAYGDTVIVQPFMAEITEYGESSLIFFNGQFSHAVRRQPQLGDYRANSAYGVQISTISPNPIIIAQARKVLDYIEEIPLYARVDGIAKGETFVLNELEVIEPALYLDREKSAVENFTHAIIAKLSLKG